MLWHALRRLLWTIPTLVGVSLLSFLVLSFVPDPTEDPAVATKLGPAAVTEQRRERFLDLPRFVNLAPRDVRTRALAAVAAIADGGDAAPEARRELARLGGAALPHVLPTLDALAPEPRARVAVALAPIAHRMRLARRDADDPARAAAFWLRFWTDRGIEFRPATLRSAVRRLERYRSASRAADLEELDTYALPFLFEALTPPDDAAGVDAARVLVDVAAHVTGRDDRIGLGDDPASARACVERWRRWWATYGSDYVVFTGPMRVAAVVLETRYGKWALGTVTRGLGLGADGTPVSRELAARAPVTLTLLFGAIALAYLVAIPLGALSAAYRGGRVDLAIACAVLGLFAVPTAVVAVLVARVGAGHGGLLVPTIVLALGLVAAPTRQQRSALASALAQDYVRAAIARGAGPVRTTVVHGLRNAILPVATLAALEPPLALGGAFVVERVFGLRGLGEVTIEAVQTRDIGWLMVISILAATLAAVAVVATDLVYALADRRLGPSLLTRRRR